MRTPSILIYNILLTLWYTGYHVMLLSLYLSLYAIWYFRFPSKEKIRLFLLADDYDDSNKAIYYALYREWDHRPHVTVYANEIFKIWNIKPIRVSTDEYFEKHCSVAYFEKPTKKS